MSLVVGSHGINRPTKFRKASRPGESHRSKARPAAGHQETNFLAAKSLVMKCLMSGNGVLHNAGLLPLQCSQSPAEPAGHLLQALSSGEHDLNISSMLLQHPNQVLRKDAILTF